MLPNVNVQQFGYDLEGRRIWAKHPSQLTPGPDSVAFIYDTTVFGQLKAMSDVFGNTYNMTFDSLGRATRVTRLAQRVDSVYESITYDADGRVASRAARSSAHPSGPVFQETLAYDARGKVTGESTNGDQFTYAPLGSVVHSLIYPANHDETFVFDALGNRFGLELRDRRENRADHAPGLAASR